MSKSFLYWSTVFLVPLFLAACSEQQSSESIPRFVKVSQVSAGSEAELFSFNGVVRERDEINLAFRVGGQIVKLLVNEGDRVSAGQVIAILDDRDYKVQYNSAKANYMQAKNEYERYRELFDRKKLPENNLDKVEATHLSAKSSFEAAENALYDTKLVAPFTGSITKRMIANFENVAPGQPIVALIDVSALEVRFTIPVDLVGKVKDAKSLICDFSMEGLSDVPAKFIAINQKASSNDQYEVRVQIDGDYANLKSGMTTKIRVVSVHPQQQAASVSVGAVFYANQKPHVWVVDLDSMIVKSQPICLGNLMNDGKIEVTSGVKGDETIVIAGVNSLKENQQVRILGS